MVGASTPGNRFWCSEELVPWANTVRAALSSCRLKSIETDAPDAALQFARLSGFSPIVTTASLHNAPLLQTLGATHVLDRNVPSDRLIAEATKLAGGLFEVVYDAISSSNTLGVAYALTARGGNLVVVLPEAAEELETKSKEDGKSVHMAHGLFVAPVNHAIGRTLLDALPSLLQNGDIMVSGQPPVYRVHLLRVSDGDSKPPSNSQTARRSCPAA